MFHSYNMLMQEGETYAKYQERRLEVLRGATGSHIFQAALDVIESQARMHKDECFATMNKEEAEGHRLSAKVLDGIYEVLKSQSTKLANKEEMEEQRSRRVQLDRDAELRVQDRARALAVGGSRGYRPNMNVPGR